ncbi:MAG TPA: YbhB/YbcL family Raf kinase inhibitor-like protein [Bacteroidales bacterium]|nr:YbhB/YbcL family Raf kinase inhibitor-like protein [Bacteroidales bacterium]
MKSSIKYLSGYITILVVSIFLHCRKSEDPVQEDFILSSPDIKADSLLPVDYTCDGVSATLPLQWSGEPDGTAAFALIMHHTASPTDIHWYWVIYNILPTVHSLPRNVTGIGTLGTNSVNDRNNYAPPCSQGPGIKAYTYTIYALSSNPDISVPQTSVTRDVLLDAINGITLSSAKMTVYYSRNVK